VYAGAPLDAEDDRTRNSEKALTAKRVVENATQERVS
jgi:hypothetical protein